MKIKGIIYEYFIQIAGYPKPNIIRAYSIRNLLKLCFQKSFRPIVTD